MPIFADFCGDSCWLEAHLREIGGDRAGAPGDLLSEDVEAEVGPAVVRGVEDPKGKSAIAATDVKDDRTRPQAVSDEKACQLVADLEQLLVVLAHEAEVGWREWERTAGLGHRRGSGRASHRVGLGLTVGPDPGDCIGSQLLGGVPGTENSSADIARIAAVSGI